MNFQVTVLKILVSYPAGFAVMADLKRDMAILATSGRDWAERTQRLAARMPDLDIFSQGLVERESGGCRQRRESGLHSGSSIGGVRGLGMPPVSTNIQPLQTTRPYRFTPRLGAPASFGLRVVC